MKKIEKVNFSEGSIGKSGSGDNCVLEEPSQVELLLGQIAHMADRIDEFRSKISNQDLAIIAKDQHINNLNKAMVAKGQHIAAKGQHIAAKDQHIAAKDQHIAAKDQHIANLERLIRDRDAEHYRNPMNLTKEIVKIKKYSVFYNLLSRFRRELLMWLGKIQK